MRTQSISNVLDKVQHSRATFDKYTRILLRTFEETKFEDFFEEYTTILLNLFVTDTKIKNIYIQRSLEFMANFAASFCKNDEEHIFYTKLIQEVLNYHNASNPDVRFRVCEFIKLLLNGIGDTNLDDNLCDAISLVMQERMNDIKPNVRLQAVLSSQRLQDPDNKEDPILNTYIKALATESSPLIRKNIIECMAISMKTLTVLLERCLDESDSVKLAAFKKVSRIPVKNLRLEQRQFVLRNGLRSDAKIVDFINGTLLQKWISKYEGNYLEFCKALKLDATEEEFKQTIELLESVLPSLFKSNPANELKDILNLNDDKVPVSLTFESSVYWRCLIQYFGSNSVDFGECLEGVMPDLITLIEFIDRYYKQMKEGKSEWEQLKENQIMTQLLKIVLKYEMLDSAERLRTGDFITNILTDAVLHYDNIFLITKICEKGEPDVNIRSQEICTIVSSIKDPLVTTQMVDPTKEELRKRDLRLAPLRVKLNIMREDMDTAVLKQEFQQAGQLKNEITVVEKQIEDIKKEYDAQTVVTKVPKTDDQTISKCMDVLIAFLHSPQVKELTAALRTNMDDFVKTNLLSITDLNSDFKSLRCYGLFCIIDKKEAFSAIQIFCQQLLLYHYNLTYSQSGITISAEVVTDLLLLYGTSIFGDEDNSELETTKKGNKKSLYNNTLLDESIPDRMSKATLQDVIEIFSNMLDDPNPELREIGGSCLIKLLFYNIIKGSSLLSKLFIKWFNPATAKDLKLRQMLGIFFSMYVLKVPGSLTMVEKAFIPTINIVLNAPPNSPLVDIDIDSMLKFLVDISRPHQQKRDKGLEVHKNIAVQISNEICQKPQEKCVPVYIRTLLALDTPYDDPVILEDLKKLANKMLTLMTVSQKQLKKQIEKYIEKLNMIEFDPVTAGSGNNIEVNLSNEVENMSVNSGKRKRDLSHDNDKLPTVTESVTNDREDEEMVIENVNSDDDSSSEKDNTAEEPPLPRRSLRRAARLI